MLRKTLRCSNLFEGGFGSHIMEKDTTFGYFYKHFITFKVYFQTNIQQILGLVHYFDIGLPPIVCHPCIVWQW